MPAPADLKRKINQESRRASVNFEVGNTVQAGDRDNYGKVVAVSDDGLITVRFVNPQSGATATKPFTPDQLTKMDHKPEPELPPMPEGFNAQELMARDFPEPKWILPNLLTEGLAILAGRPKTGKSWMALNLSLATATGGRALGKIKVESGPVLYLALEDSQRRLKSRLAQNLCNALPPGDLYFFNQWPRIDEGALPLLGKWLESHPGTRFIIIDTLAKLWPKSENRNAGTLYNADSDTMTAIKNIADLHETTILCITHLRKAIADDVLEQISGSMGISGTADTLLVLQRCRGKADATLLVTGRDVEETELALQFDKSLMTWCILGNADEYRRSQEQTQVLEVLKETGQAMGLRDIATVLGKKPDNIHHRLRGLLKDGLVIRGGYGKYQYNNNQSVNLLNVVNQSISQSSPGIDSTTSRLTAPVLQESKLDAGQSTVSGQDRQIDYFDSSVKCEDELQI